MFDWNNHKAMTKEELHQEFAKLPLCNKIGVFRQLKPHRRVLVRKVWDKHREHLENRGLSDEIKETLLQPFEKFDSDIYLVKIEDDDQFKMFVAILHSHYGITFSSDRNYDLTRFDNMKQKIEKKEDELMQLYSDVGLEAEAIIINEFIFRRKEILTFEKQIDRYRDVWVELLKMSGMSITAIDRTIPQIKKIFKASVVAQKREMQTNISKQMKEPKSKIDLQKELEQNYDIPKEFQRLVNSIWVKYQLKKLPNPNFIKNEVGEIFNSIYKIWELDK